MTSQQPGGSSGARPTWAADYEVSVELVRGLIEAQFPHLADARIGLLAEGWDNAMYRVDAAPSGPLDATPAEAAATRAWAFRFPRREAALATLAREVAVLPTLADMLPLPIPRPMLLGVPSQAHPRPFWGGPLLHGAEILHADVQDPIGAASAIGDFLRALHAPELIARLHAAAPEALAVVPLDPNVRADAASVAVRARQRLDAIDAPAPLRAELDALLERAADLPMPRLRPVLSHGDLHVRHVLLDRGQISGIVDWGDLCFTDRSVDLSIAFAAFSDDARAALLDAYGRIDEATTLRARAVAAFLCAAVAHHAQDSGSVQLFDAAVAGLVRSVAP